MSTHINFVPRLDSAFGGASAAMLDPDKLGEARRDRSGRMTFAKLGTEIGTMAEARRRVASLLGKRYEGKAIGEERERIIQDAASDFVGSELEMVLGPASTITRGDDDPFIFVARPGSPPLLPLMANLKPGMRTASYRVREQTGQARWVEPHAVRELERAGFRDEKKRYGAHYYGISWGSTIPAQWEADHLGIDLMSEGQSAATYALDVFQEHASTWGNVDLEVPGFATLGDAVLALGGARFSGGTVTAIQMLQRITAFASLYRRANAGRAPTQVLAPHEDRDAMMNTFFGVGSEGPSVWERALAQNSWLANVVWDDRMASGNADGTGPRWVIFSQNTKELYIEHTDSMVFGPFPDMMEMSWVVLRRFGGVISLRPERVLYVDFT
jgi:hypothetical protein